MTKSSSLLKGRFAQEQLLHGCSLQAALKPAEVIKASLLLSKPENHNHTFNMEFDPFLL